MFRGIIANAMLSNNVLTKKVGTFVHQNSDKILLTVGVGLICGGTVSAVISSKNIANVVDKHKKAIAKVSKIEDQKTRGKEKLEVYKNTAVEMLMTFGPCVLLTGTGIACILGSHHILTQKLASCQAAYAMLDTSFREYRDRVKEKIGEEEELKVFNNRHEIEVTNIDENGNVTTDKIAVEDGPGDLYTYKFDAESKNPNYLSIPRRNREFLEQRRWYLQDQLNRMGEVSLADVLWALDAEEDKRHIPSYAFDIVWRRGSVILFGYESDLDFMADRKPDVTLHFNPDGFRRKLNKEEKAYLKSALQTKNKMLKTA